MPNLIINQRDYQISDRRVVVTASIELKVRADLSVDEIAERMSFGAEIENSLTQIEIENALTGEMNVISVDSVINSLPDTNWDEMYLETTSHIAIDENNHPPLTIEELRTEQRRYGRNV
ncbi:MAG: hypothetical protein Q9P01_16960 [Anaerolineae bacterium]|nr:hypothetical protein [Anaerolineae bacterium]MDQ7036453.1 hypothetical protein [Anaerolineae bacterium]